MGTWPIPKKQSDTHQSIEGREALAHDAANVLGERELPNIIVRTVLQGTVLYHRPIVPAYAILYGSYGSKCTSARLVNALPQHLHC